METKKVNIIKTKLPDKGAFTIETSPDFIKLHSLMILSGKRGGGKSVSIANFIRTCKEKNYFDKIYLVTPTYASNKSIWDIASIEPEDVFEPDIGVVKLIKEKIEAEKQEWDEFLQELKLYKKFKKEIENDKYIDDENLIKYLENGYLDNKERPKWKYKVEQPPRLGVIFDDCLNSEVMARRSSGLINFCIKHRHVADGLGVSIFLLVQAYCSHDGINKAIRENTTQLLLFKTNSEVQLKKIKDECDLPITEEEFQEICNKAFEVPYQFVLIDFAAKCPSFQFRIGWNEIIIPPSLKNKCTCKK